MSLCFIRRHFIKNLGRVTTAAHVTDGLIGAEKRAVSVKNRTLISSLQSVTGLPELSTFGHT